MQNMEEPTLKKPKHLLQFVFLGVILILIGITTVTYQTIFQSTQFSPEDDRFVVPTAATTKKDVAEALLQNGYLTEKQHTVFSFLFSIRNPDQIKPGGYKIKKGTSPWNIMTILSREPYMKWVTIQEGLRKEEIAELLADALDWNTTETEKWIITDTTLHPEYVEGVYFPDTYLLSTEESPARIADRLRTRFEEKFQPYATEALEQNIKWPTLIKIASLVQREAANKADMPLIAGIIWNRLLSNMKLDIDATLQYARGNKGNGWWAPITVADKQIDSPFNTYKYTGLPPQPIANPGEDAIKAVLFPTETDCLYYLHDTSGVTYCSPTYEGHQTNIERYLR